jgi:hypothetical protein
MARFTTWLFHYWQSFMTWLDALTFEAIKAKLYHWQTFAAGLVAVVAAIITVGGGEVFARCRECRERMAILLSLAAEVRMYLDLFIRRRAMLLRQDAWSMSASELKTLAELPSPIIFSASADLSASFGQRINR